MHQTVSTPAPATFDGERRRARRKKQSIYGLIALVVLWIVGSIISGEREKPIPVTTEKAIRKTIIQTVSATGKIQPEIEVKISPEVAGEITDLPVVDGMAVKKGDLLHEDQTGFLQGTCRTTARGDQRSESDQSCSRKLRWRKRSRT